MVIKFLPLVIWILFQASKGCRVSLMRKKRDTVPEVSLPTFFPECMTNRSVNISEFSDRNWKGAVSFALFHSSWYKRTEEQICVEGHDTVACWVDQLTDFVSGSSHVLRIAQECVSDYDKACNGTDNTILEFPNGMNRTDSSKCTNITSSEYKEELPIDLNSTTLGDEDQSVTEIDDFLTFVMKDLRCPTCECIKLFANKEYFEQYEFSDDRECNECWLTRLATSIREDSPFWEPVSRLAVTKNELTRTQHCPDVEIPNDPDEVVSDILKFNVMCSPLSSRIQVRLQACGLVALGYDLTREIAIVDPTMISTPIASHIDKQCYPILLPTIDPANKTVCFDFNRTECDGYQVMEGNDTMYTFSLRHLLSDFSYEVSGISRKMDINLNFTCAYREVYHMEISSPFNVEALIRSVTYDLPDVDALQVSMSVFRDRFFTVPFTEKNNVVLIPDVVWVFLTHDGKDERRMEVSDCWMTPDSDRNSEFFYDLVINGCSAIDGDLNVAIELTTCEAKNASFGFSSFRWSHLSDEIYLHCDVATYAENNDFCEQKDCSSQTKRRKRSVEGPSKAISISGLQLTIDRGNCDQPCSCDQICYGCDGRCGCLHGYTLSDDGITCLQDSTR